MRKIKLISLAICVVCLLLQMAAAAEPETGTLKIRRIYSDVCLHYVADENAVLVQEFASAQVEDLSNEENGVKNAKVLRDFVNANNFAGKKASPDEQGTVSYSDLAKGFYLVCSLAEPEEFKPFLVRIPTEINGNRNYDVVADPKGEEPTEPTEPAPTTEPTTPGPSIPQTGSSVLPKYILLVIGTAAAVFGMIDLIFGRERKA